MWPCTFLIFNLRLDCLCQHLSSVKILKVTDKEYVLCRCFWQSMPVLWSSTSSSTSDLPSSMERMQQNCPMLMLYSKCQLITLHCFPMLMCSVRLRGFPGVHCATMVRHADAVLCLCCISSTCCNARQSNDKNYKIRRKKLVDCWASYCVSHALTQVYNNKN